MPNKWHLEKTTQVTTQIVRHGLEKFAKIMVDEIDSGAPGGIKGETKLIFGLKRIRVVNDHEAAAHVEFGTPPHRIEPTKSHGLLVWDGDDGTVFVKGGVDHPGTDPNPFMRNGIDAAVSRIRSAFR